MSDINKILEDLEDSVLKAESSYQLWWALAHDGLKDYKPAMNGGAYVDFFHASTPLFLQCIFINISKVYDRSSGTSGIKKLKDSLSDNNRRDLVDLIEDKLRPHETSISSVKGIRNSSEAHKNFEKTTEQIFQDNPITPDTIKEIIEVTKEIIVEVSSALSRDSNVLLTDRYWRATINLLQRLDENRK